MNATGRWKLRWRTAPKSWFSERSRRSTQNRSRAMRFALDRTLQQIAQFPFSGAWCGVRYPNLNEMPETYRVIAFSDMVLFYRLIEAEQIILVVQIQTTAMDTPTPEVLNR